MRKSTIIGVVGAAAVALTGCSPQEDPSPMPPAPGTPPPPSAIAPAKDSKDGDETENVNVDLQFAQQMLAHHEAGLEVIEVGLKNMYNEEVLRLAESMEEQHGEQIQRIEAWLREYDETGVVPHEVGSGEDAIMPDVDVRHALGQIEESQRGQVVTIWLKTMITHHQAVVQIAKTELDKGEETELREIAREILQTRKAELNTMRELLEAT